MIKIDMDLERMFNKPDEVRDEVRKNDERRDFGLKEPSTIDSFKDLSYGPFGQDNLVDIYYPKGTKEALPTIISVHGGGFFYGDKEIYKFYTMFLATQGFTVVNFNYRLAPEHIYPAPIEDLNTLAEWLVINHERYYIDLDNVFMVGDSAGGQLAEQYATILTNSSYRKSFHITVPNIKIKALALNCSLLFIGKGQDIDENFPYYFGKQIDAHVQKQFPVEDFITKNFPPTFIMTSSHDFLKELAKPFAHLLEEKGVTVAYHFYKNDDGSRLEHVFHIDQKSEIAKACNLSELDFFRTFIS